MDAQNEDVTRAVEGGALTVAAAVEFSGLPRTELYKRMGSGELAFIKIGKRRLIPRDALRALLAKYVVAAN